jgi:hypothetical protein
MSDKLPIPQRITIESIVTQFGNYPKIEKEVKPICIIHFRIKGFWFILKIRPFHIYLANGDYQKQHCYWFMYIRFWKIQFHNERRWRRLNNIQYK